MDRENVNQPTDASKIAARLEYAARGWTSFPVPPGIKKSHKKAQHSNGERWGASKHPDVIQRDCRRWPDANIGIPTGPENGFFVIEADTVAGHYVDGLASIKKLECE